ncbi:hypothetical protein BJ138DRAFT_644721 [Hygrophoropsis aurantiaca]|uniref:Uncharacterized protein n=1 Tax=Hygrophoropsis aurantiaca TaxID=72124 RepID=A0ACB8A024_9AGAM|nr:hypothetical protein BJ138DRAFT_644721 [Hygrophoropsis aurantiaca]
MAFYLHTEYNWLALAPGDDPGGVNVDTSSEPAIFEERTTAFWDVFGALWSTNTSPKAPDADAPLQHGVVSEVGNGIDYQRSVCVNPPAPHAQEEEADTAHNMVEDLNDKILADAGTISALQYAIEYLSRRQEEDRRQFHDDLAAKQVVIDSMAVQIADKDLAIMDLHRTTQATTLPHDEMLSTMRHEAAAKQRAIDELKSELDDLAKERAQHELELTSLNSTLKADLGKLAGAVVQMFPGSDNEDNNEDDEGHDDDEEDDDPLDYPSTITSPPTPRTVSRITRWTYSLKYHKKPLLTTTSLFRRVIKSDAALTPSAMQPDAVVSSSPPNSKSKIRPVDTSTGVRRRRPPLPPKTPTPKFTSTSPNTSTRTSTIASPKNVAKKISARKPFQFQMTLSNLHDFRRISQLYPLHKYQTRIYPTVLPSKHYYPPPQYYSPPHYYPTHYYPRHSA